MFFNSTHLQKLILLLGVVSLMACATKPEVVKQEPVKELAEFSIQQEQQQFEQALVLIKAQDAQEQDLQKAKGLFDALYAKNQAYLGALINSADLSLRLGKMAEAKTLYLKALQNIEDQKANVSTSGQALSEHSSLFSLHAYNQLGLIERQQGQFDKAELYYKQALELNNEHPVTLKNLAILLDLYKGKLVEALALYEQYQRVVGDSDPKIKDWIFDLKNRLPQEEASNE